MITHIDKKRVALGIMGEGDESFSVRKIEELKEAAFSRAFIAKAKKRSMK